MSSLATKINNSRFVAFLRGWPKRKSFPLAFAGLTLLLIYIAYLIFAFNGPIPVIDGTETSSELYTLFANIVNQTDYTGLQITMLVLLLAEGGFAYYLIKSQKMTINIAIVMIIMAGFIMRIGYGIFTDAIITRQHDLGSLTANGTGHYGITVYIFNNGSLPDRVKDYLGNYDLDESYAMYNPMLTHIVFALFMRFNSLFLGTNIWVLYQSIRIITIFFSCLSLYIIYLIFKELQLKGRGLVIATAFIAFSPVLYRLSAMTNNDPLCYFFIFLAILFTVCWLNRPTIINIIGIAISLGLGMASKLTAGLLAIPIAGVFIYRLFKSIKEKKVLSLILSFALFAIIVFPLGLFFPVRSYLLYDQPFTYIWGKNSLNSNLEIMNTDFFARFVSFPFSEYFKCPYEIIWRNDIIGQDYNIYTTAMKSFLFGEFYFGNVVLSVFLLVANLAVVILMLGSILWTMSYTISMHKLEHKSGIFILSAIGVTFFISYISFNINFPFGCTMDFRYVVACLLPIAFFLGYGYELTQKATCSPETKRFGATAFPLVIACFCVLSALFYISAA